MSERQNAKIHAFVDALWINAAPSYTAQSLRASIDLGEFEDRIPPYVSLLIDIGAQLALEFSKSAAGMTPEPTEASAAIRRVYEWDRARKGTP